MIVYLGKLKFVSKYKNLLNGCKVFPFSIFPLLNFGRIYIRCFHVFSYVFPFNLSVAVLGV